MGKIEQLNWSSSFKRAFSKRVLNTPNEANFETKLKVFLENPFDPRIKTHKLSGKLKALWAFMVDYDCRVVFTFISDTEVLLIDIGSHEEVY